MWLHFRSFPQSARGTFIIRQIIASGMRAAISVTRLHSPLGAASSIISRAIWRAGASNFATARGRNDALYDLRIAVCQGRVGHDQNRALAVLPLVLVFFRVSIHRQQWRNPLRTEDEGIAKDRQRVLVFGQRPKRCADAAASQMHRVLGAHPLPDRVRIAGCEESRIGHLMEELEQATQVYRKALMKVRDKTTVSR